MEDANLLINANLEDIEMLSDNVSLFAHQMNISLIPVAIKMNALQDIKLTKLIRRVSKIKMLLDVQFLNSYKVELV